MSDPIGDNQAQEMDDAKLTVELEKERTACAYTAISANLRTLLKEAEDRITTRDRAKEALRTL